MAVCIGWRAAQRARMARCFGAWAARRVSHQHEVRGDASWIPPLASWIPPLPRSASRSPSHTLHSPLARTHPPLHHPHLHTSTTPAPTPTTPTPTATTSTWQMRLRELDLERAELHEANSRIATLAFSQAPSTHLVT